MRGASKSPALPSSDAELGNTKAELKLEAGTRVDLVWASAMVSGAQITDLHTVTPRIKE